MSMILLYQLNVLFKKFWTFSEGHITTRQSGEMSKGVFSAQ